MNKQALALLLIAPGAAGALECGGKEVTIYGTPEPDFIYATMASDVIHGLAGNDHIVAYGGNDVICGGTGDDTIYAYSGRDTIFGETGNDLIAGHSGNDRLYGGYGTDALLGGLGSDVVWGGYDHQDMVTGTSATVWGETYEGVIYYQVNSSDRRPHRANFRRGDADFCSGEHLLRGCPQW